MIIDAFQIPEPTKNGFSCAEICSNCIFAGQLFLIGKTYQLHCEHAQYTQEMFDRGEISAWDTLKELYDSCQNFKKI